MVYTEVINTNVSQLGGGIIYTIKIGRNETENDDLIRKSNKNDLWFHLEDNPSPHGFISVTVNEGVDVSKAICIPHEIIYKTALLVKKYSNCKHIPVVSVIYTKIENLSLTKKLGTVLIKKKTNKIKV
jgi:predicted ribosome quality control (RQC) complex YloA/Tae2 family protein